MTTVTHIVMLKFGPDTSEASVKQTFADGLKLKDICLHPKTGAPYIISVKGGRDISNEGLQNGFTHVFIMEFESIEDRDYYVSEDPAHQEFIKKTKELPIGGAQVMDFIAGSY